MTRNLCSTSCDWCHQNYESIRLVEEPRPATPEDCGYYWEPTIRQDFIVAHAECDCGAKYIAWCAVKWRAPNYRNDCDARGELVADPHYREASV